jgi:hypothetical protein
VSEQSPGKTARSTHVAPTLRTIINAHVHLGNLAFDRWTNDAIPHYEAGLRVGELSLGDGFDGVLPWGRIHNRPFSDA